MCLASILLCFFFFFFNDTATTEIYTLSLHDALPICWQVSAAGFRLLIQEGSARLGKWRGEDTTVYYLKKGERQKVQDGSFKVSGFRPDGSIITDVGSYIAKFIPTDVWRLTSHDAGHH